MVECDHFWVKSALISAARRCARCNEYSIPDKTKVLHLDAIEAAHQRGKAEGRIEGRAEGFAEAREMAAQTVTKRGESVGGAVDPTLTAKAIRSLQPRALEGKE